MIKGKKSSSKITYNAPIVKEIASPIFLEMEACNFQIIGSGKNRTVTTVIVLVSAQVK